MGLAFFPFHSAINKSPGKLHHYSQNISIIIPGMHLKKECKVYPMQNSRNIQLYLDYPMRQPLLKEKALKKLKIHLNKSPTLSNTALKKMHGYMHTSHYIPNISIYIYLFRFKQICCFPFRKCHILFSPVLGLSSCIFIHL